MNFHFVRKMRADRTIRKFKRSSRSAPVGVDKPDGLAPNALLTFKVAVASKKAVALIMDSHIHRIDFVFSTVVVALYRLLRDRLPGHKLYFIIFTIAQHVISQAFERWFV